MLARDVMTSPVLTIGPEMEIPEIAKLLLEQRISAVPVVDADRKLLGMVSEGDLVRRVQSKAGHQPSWWLTLMSSPAEEARRYIRSHGRVAREIMTRPVVTVAETTPVAEVAAILERNRIKRVPVLRDGKLSGIVSRANLLHALATPPAGEQGQGEPDEELRDRVLSALREAGVRTWSVNVIVTGGVAHLWGAVESREEKEAARVAAENVPAIREVEDNVRVLPQIVVSVLGAE